MHTPGRGDEALRGHRVSLPGHSYFVTLCTRNRAGVLNQPPVATALRAEINAIETDAHWIFRAGVVMPDHLHIFIRLSSALPLSRCIARFKTKTNPALQGAGWQANFYEHRLRPDDSVEDVLRYIFLNPYRGNLVSPGEPYPWFWLGTEEAAWFNALTADGLPFPEWLR